MRKIANWIIDKKIIILIVTAVLCLASVYGIFNVNINYDMSKYLPETSSVKNGMELMKKDFGELSVITVMFENLSEQEQLDRQNELADISNVKTVVYFQDDEAYQKDNYSKYVITVNADTYSEEAIDVLNTIKDKYGDSAYTCGEVVDNEMMIDTLANELPIIVLIAFIIVAIILLVLCSSWIEPVLYLIGIAVAILFNMGSNALLPSVSFMAYAIAALLQLGLSMDYTIMLMNRYSQERKETEDPATAMKKALGASVSAISGSSVTTIVGLLVLLFMSFRICANIGIVLAKGVFMSLLCVFTVLPCLTVLFDKAIYKTQKKSLQFNLKPFINVISKLKFALIAVFAVITIGSVFLKGGLGIGFVKSFDNPEQEKIEEIFGADNQMVLMYDKTESNENISSYISWLESQDDVNYVQDYSNTIGKSYNYSLFAEDMDISEDQAKILYQLYKETSNNEPYEKITAYDLICYIDEKIAQNPTYSDFMSDEQKADIKKARAELEDGKKTIADAEIEISDGEKQLIDAEKQIADNEALINESEDELIASEKELLSQEQQIIDGETKIAGAEAEIKKQEKPLSAGEAQLSAAEKELTAQEQQLSAGEAQLSAAEAELSAQEQQLSAGEAKLSAAEKELPAQEQQLSAGEAQLSAAEAELSAQEQQLSAGEAQLSAAEAELNEQESALTAGEAELNAHKEQMRLSGMTDEMIQQQLGEQEQKLKESRAALEAGKQELTAQKEQLTSARAQLEAGKQELTAQKEQLAAGRAQLEAGKQEIAAQKEQLTSARAQLEAGKQELTAQKKQLTSARAQLEAGKRQIAAQKKQLAEARILIEDGKKQIEAGRSEIASGRSQIEDGKLEIEKNKTELEDAKHKIEDGRRIYSVKMTAEELSEELDQDKSDIEEMQKIRRMSTLDVDDLSITLEELIRFINADVLSDETYSAVIDEDMRTQVKDGEKQINESRDMLVGKQYNRMIVSADLPTEEPQTFSFITELSEKSESSFTKAPHLIGSSIMAYEMNNGFEKEMNLITILTIVSILVVVWITFRSFGSAAILVILIQSAVFIATAIVGIQGYSINYISLILVQCILMGATIDYGILLLDNYRESRMEQIDKLKACGEAMNNSIRTILSSSLILIASCVTVSIVMTQKVIAQTCMMIAYGTACSLLLVLFILPCALLIFDRFIVKKGSKQ